MKKASQSRLIQGGTGDDILLGTQKSDIIEGKEGDDVIVGGLGYDVMTGGEGADTFVVSGNDTGDTTFGRADTITDFGADDIIDLTGANILYFNGSDPEPLRGGMSIWQAGSDTYISWKAGGSYHDIVLADYQGDPDALLGQIRWFDDDYAGSTATSGVLVPGESISGEIQDSTDQDWFRIDLADGQLYTFDIQGEADGGGTLIDPYLVLFDADGAYVTDGYELLQYAPEEAGTYYVAVSGSGYQGTYTLETSAVEYQDDYRGDTDTEGEIAAGESITGEIGIPNEEDWLRIELQAGEIYTFTASGEATGGGTLVDPYLMLLDEDGSWLTDSGSELIYTAEEDATCYIAVGSYGTTGTYTLEVGAESYADDYGGDAGTAGAIASGETVNGLIGQNGDQDWFAFDLAAGDTCTIDLQSGSSGDGSLGDPFLALYDDAGAQVAEDDDGGGGLNSQIVYEATEDGTYYIAAQALGGIGTGDYALSLLVAA